MIARLFLLSGLIPLILSFLARKFLSDGALRSDGDKEVGLTGRELVKKILAKSGAESVDVIEKTRPFMVVGAKSVVLPPKLADSRKARDVAEAGLLAGMVLMARKQESVVKWRVWAAKFSAALPAFTIIVMAFALVIGRLGGSWVIGIIAASLGLTTVLLWFTLPVERAAAGVVADLVEESTVVPRRSEGEILSNLVRALGWRRIVPAAVAWMGGK
ncbi:MAG: zinc metallopeptidase [Akkermansiaceae bacterium]|jgi:Zn-dependent membrane protease YugP